MLFYYVFNDILSRSYFKFKLNLFFFKSILSLNFKQTMYIHLFINTLKQFKIKFFKNTDKYTMGTLILYLYIFNSLLLLILYIL